MHAVLCFVAVCALSGCVSTQQRGDRAFQAGQYNEALDHYERAMDGGDRSAELYANAARAALRIGDFSLAERYFNRALQNGGGESVARELADFYIATSNYTKAVRVLQTVLETASDPQTIFNDLGTALMYAGSALNAESYLMVAQQMKPDDPVPYVNLGVLYDKHLHNPRLAYGFYQCFLKLGPNSRQSGRVRARVSLLETRYKGDFPARYAVACGQPYQPAAASAGDLKREVARRLGDASAGAADGAAQQPGSDAGASGPSQPSAPDTGEAGEVGEITIDRGVVEPPTPSPGARASEAPDHARTATLAETAFANHNHQQVIELLKKLPVEALTPRLMGIYGQSLSELGEYERARRWLSAAVADAPEPATVFALWTAYRQLNRIPAAQALCERFAEQPGYGEFLKQCASVAEARDATAPAAP